MTVFAPYALISIERTTTLTHESQFPTEPGHEGNSAEEEPKWNPSESQDYPVSCPNCGKETPFVLWVMLNTKENPEEAKQLAAGSLASFTCPHCGYHTPLNYPCLYMDPDRNLMIYNICDDDEMREQAIQTFDTLQKENDPISNATFRIVDSTAQLSDKVTTFTTGFDDKVMEVLKLSVLGHAQSQGKVTEDSYCAVQFIKQKDNELHFRIQANEETFLSSISTEAYQVFADSLAAVEIPFVHPYVVDLEWAYHALSAIANS